MSRSSLRPFRVVPVWLLLVLCLLSWQVNANETGVATPRARAESSLQRGSEWLLTHQNADGSWGKDPHPAISALAAMALHDQALEAGEGNPRVRAAINLAMDYVLRFRQKDGSIYPADRDQKSSANYPNYTTSIALLAMATVNRPQDLDAIKAARAYVMSAQFGDPNTVDYGGLGYGKTGRADLSNGSWAAMALKATEYLDREPNAANPEAATAETTAMWTKMQTFLTKTQNLPETNPAGYVSDHADDIGGFLYRPNESKAAGGSRDGDGKTTRLISSGSMSYAGLMSMVYARLDRQDIRVKGAMAYLKKHYTLDENPGQGKEGLYYYLLVMAKALDAYGDDRFTSADDVAHDWRAELLEKVVGMQGADGSWINSDGRFMESLPELSTPYAMLTLKVASSRLPAVE